MILFPALLGLICIGAGKAYGQHRLQCPPFCDAPEFGQTYRITPEMQQPQVDSLRKVMYQRGIELTLQELVYNADHRISAIRGSLTYKGRESGSFSAGELKKEVLIQCDPGFSIELH